MKNDINWLSERIIGAAIAVHRALGPGLLESTYAACLAEELRYGGLTVEREVAVPVVYRDVRLDVGYRMDMVVEGLVVVELKVVAKLERVHTSQMLTYLRLSGLNLGLLINFNGERLTSGVRRIVRGHGVPGLAGRLLVPEPDGGNQAPEDRP